MPERWERLFEDLDAEFAEFEREDLHARATEQTRAEWAALTLADRLRGNVGRSAGWWLADGTRLEGRLLDLGDGWLLVSAGSGRVVLPSPALRAVRGLGPAAMAPVAGRRFPLGALLRGLARDRARVTALLLSGPAPGGPVPGTTVSGTIDRVGADHLDLAERAADPGDRRVNVLTIPFAGLAQLRLG